MFLSLQSYDVIKRLSNLSSCMEKITIMGIEKLLKIERRILRFIWYQYNMGWLLRSNEERYVKKKI